MLLGFLLVLLLLPAFKGLSSVVFSHSTYVNSLSSQNSASVVYNSAFIVSSDFCHLKDFPVMSQTNGKAFMAYETGMYPTLVQFQQFMNTFLSSQSFGAWWVSL